MALEFVKACLPVTSTPQAWFEKSDARVSLPPTSRLASTTAALCMLSCGFSLKKRRKRCQMFSAQAETIQKVDGTRLALPEDESISNLGIEDVKNDQGSLTFSEPSVETLPRDVLGAYIIGALVLPAWHILPVFLDLKLAADPALPGLTEASLPFSSTAIFVGWLVSATVLDKALEIFTQKQLIVLHILGLLLVTLATIVLPHVTAGNLVVFTAIRFVYGLLMNITALQCVYIQERLPERLQNPALVSNSITYCLVQIFMAWSCSALTSLDWRLEALAWYAGPLILAIVVGFPDCWQTMRSLPLALGKKTRGSESGGKADMSSSERRNMIALAVGFLACGCGFYGLTYSAGQLSPDIYMSSMLLHGGDIFGYLLALSANKYGRNNAQACAFFMAGVCLLLCSTGEPGTPLVLSAAVVGRLSLDICFTTVYLALAQVFSTASSKLAFTACETTARVGGVMAPMSGTWPTSVSCPIFASLCLAAAFCTMTLPQGREVYNGGTSSRS